MLVHEVIISEIKSIMNALFCIWICQLGV